MDRGTSPAIVEFVGHSLFAELDVAVTPWVSDLDRRRLDLLDLNEHDPDHGRVDHYAVRDETGIVFADANGEIFGERGWSPEGQTYVGNDIRCG